MDYIKLEDIFENDGNILNFYRDDGVVLYVMLNYKL